MPKFKTPHPHPLPLGERIKVRGIPIFGFLIS